MTGSHGCPLCGTFFWGHLSILESPAYPRRVSLLFSSLKLSVTSPKQLFLLSHHCTLYLSVWKYPSCDNGMWACHFRLSYWSKGTLKVSLAHYGAWNLHAWRRVECIMDPEWRCGISMGWIRKLGGHWWQWSRQKKYSLGTGYLWGFRLGPTPKCFDRAGMMESCPSSILLSPVEECHLLVLTDRSRVSHFCSLLAGGTACSSRVPAAVSSCLLRLEPVVGTLLSHFISVSLWRGKTYHKINWSTLGGSLLPHIWKMFKELKIFL